MELLGAAARPSHGDVVLASRVIGPRGFGPTDPKSYHERHEHQQAQRSYTKRNPHRADSREPVAGPEDGRRVRVTVSSIRR